LPGSTVMPLNPALAQHYHQLLGLSTPWRITDIALNVPEERVDITIEWPTDRRVLCPECGKRVARKDLREERVWRHLDTMQFQTFLHCRVPRSECATHGVKTIAIPWGERNSRWTLLYEAFAVELMQQVPSLSKVAHLLHLSWDEAHALRTRAVRRGLKRRDLEDIDYLGIDEKSFGSRERYVTVLSDLTEARVLDVAPSKSTEAARDVLSIIPAAERVGVKAVAMDMSAAFERACAELVPAAEIVYDKFHVEQLLTHAMDMVRRKAHKELLREGISVFTKTRYLFLRRKERWSDRQKDQFRDVNRDFGKARFAQSKIGRAWNIKEAFRGFWDYAYLGAARRYFRRWYFWATHSRLEPIIKAARTLNTHLDGLLNYFHHGITNAFSEGINSKIQDIKSAARGFRNFENYRIAILFACGKLNMKPQ
jgi:transposase